MKYQVSFKLITPELYFTPYYMIPEERTCVESASDSDYTLSCAIAKLFDTLRLNPDHIRIISKSILNNS